MNALNNWLLKLSSTTLLWTSVVVAIITIVMKTLAWYITDSVGLLSDAMESFVNLASAIFALIMVTVAQQPADEEHPYGHHKAEYFSSGFEGVLIMGAAAAIIWASVHRVFEEVARQVPVAKVLELANKVGIDGAQADMTVSSAIVELQCQLVLQQHIVERTRSCQLRKWRERGLGENGHKDA